MKKFLFAAGLLALLSACSPDNLVDHSEFTLYYSGVTDISPSTNFNLTPTWHGETPSGFEIYKVTCNGNAVTSDCFTIEEESGIVHIQNTESLELGTYLISISCVSKGKTFRFDDAVCLNLMKPVPDSITVTPDFLQVDLGDIYETKTESPLPTAQVTVSEGSVSIKKYLIANVYRDGTLVNACKDWFAISSDGVLSIVPDNRDFVPGKYTLDLKLTTYIVGESSEEGLYRKAVTIDVTSKPLALRYNPDVEDVETGFSVTSQVPEFTGSLDDVKFSIKSVSSDAVKVTIDASTGYIVANAEDAPVGTQCKVSVSVSNKYGSAEWDDAYTVNVVDYIAPITRFSYPDNSNVIESCAFGLYVKEVDGGNVTFSFGEVPEALKELSLDAATGAVYAPDKHSIPVGSYDVTVTASNVKSRMDAILHFTVLPNPNMFTYVHWGNNLGLTPALGEASQYRWTEAGSHTVQVAESDLPAGAPVKFEIVGGSITPSIDATTGTITVNKQSKGNVFVTIVRVTVGGDSAAAVSRCFPVFFQWPSPVAGYDVRFTPMAFRVNPLKGGVSTSPVPEGSGAAVGTSSLDYRRTFNYYNLNGPASHISGQLGNVANCFLVNMWTKYYAPKAPNTGSRDPVSYFSNKDNLTKALCYVRQSDLAVVVNPNMWVDDAGPADGVMIGQMTFLAGGGDPQSSDVKIFPLAIWFDSNL